MNLVEVKILQRQISLFQHVGHGICRGHQQAFVIDEIDRGNLREG